VNKHRFSATFLGFLLINSIALADVSRTETNNGKLIMEDIPEIPQSIVSGLNRYQNVRSAGFLDWSLDGDGIYVSTRFGDVSQVHYVNHPVVPVSRWEVDG